jgi:hypothetical protein
MLELWSSIFSVPYVLFSLLNLVSRPDYFIPLLSVPLSRSLLVSFYVSGACPKDQKACKRRGGLERQNERENNKVVKGDYFH